MEQPTNTTSRYFNYQDIIELLRTWTVGLLDCWTVGQLDCWTIEYSNTSNETILELYRAWTVGQLDCWTIEYSNISKETIGLGQLASWPVGLLNIQIFQKKLS